MLSVGTRHRGQGKSPMFLTPTTKTLWIKCQCGEGVSGEDILLRIISYICHYPGEKPTLDRVEALHLNPVLISLHKIVV
jgi:hypothetical protein